jgi:hypothetical protein
MCNNTTTNCRCLEGLVEWKELCYITFCVDYSTGKTELLCFNSCNNIELQAVCVSVCLFVHAYAGQCTHWVTLSAFEQRLDMDIISRTFSFRTRISHFWDSSVDEWWCLSFPSPALRIVKAIIAYQEGRKPPYSKIHPVESHGANMLSRRASASSHHKIVQVC